MSFEAEDDDDFSSFSKPAGSPDGPPAPKPADDDDDDEFAEFGVPATPAAVTTSMPSLDDDDEEEFAEVRARLSPLPLLAHHHSRSCAVCGACGCGNPSLHGLGHERLRR